LKITEWEGGMQVHKGKQTPSHVGAKETEGGVVVHERKNQLKTEKKREGRISGGKGKETLGLPQ